MIKINFAALIKIHYPMKKNIFTCLCILMLCSSVSAATHISRDSCWIYGGNTGLNLNQVSLSNWASGGENAIGFDILLNYSADYKQNKHLWQNRLEMAYGLNRTETNGSKKTNDKMYFSSTYGYEMTKSLYLSALLNFNTQFAKGYDYKTDPRTYISRFMSPGYLTTGLGITWNPKAWFTATFSAISWRGTFVDSKILSAEGAFGVDPDKHLYSEMGGNLKVEMKYEFLKNMSIYSRVDLFSNYLENPQNVDVRWDVQLNMTVNKWFSANITTNMIYDDNTKIVQKDGSKGPRLQFKESLGIGFQVTF